MKNNFLSLFVVSLLLGCESQSFDQEVPHSVIPETRVGSSKTQMDEPYVFLAQKDFKSWTNISSLEDRFVACEIPESVLKSMTTDALVCSVLNYPLNFIYSAYNNPFDAVDLIIHNSTLFQELIKRDDAIDVLLSNFAQTDIDKFNRNSVFNRNESQLSYVNEMFFEYLLASKDIFKLCSRENLETLRTIARRKLLERQDNPDDFSEVSLSPLRMLACADVENAGTRSSLIWYAPLGHPLILEERQEMTSYESTMLTLSYSQEYPNAIVHGMASNLYNGNGYTWIKRDPTTTMNLSTANAWLVNNVGSVNQMADFLAEDLFSTTGSYLDAGWIYYSEVDHSAVPFSSERVLSKWGQGPLMEHIPSECPFILGSANCFKIRTSLANVICEIVGSGTVAPYMPNTYSFQHDPFRGITIEWRVQDYSGCVSSFSWDSSTHQLTCLAPGAYKIIVEGKYDNNVLVYKEKTVICLPN